MALASAITKTNHAKRSLRPLSRVALFVCALMLAIAGATAIGAWTPAFSFADETSAAPASQTANVKPKKPLLQITKATKSSITLQWTSCESAAGYKVYRSTKSSGPFKCVKTLPASSLSYKDEGASFSKPYYYKVRGYAKTAGGILNGSYSAKVYRKAKVCWSTINASRLALSQRTTQILIVEASGKKARISLHTLRSDGVWVQTFADNGFVGSEGIGKASCSHAITPAGVMKIGQAFGIKKNPGAKVPYTKVNKHHYWCGDCKSPRYNTFLDDRRVSMTKREYRESERITRYPGEYDYCLDMGHNTELTPHKGSCFFIHCSIGKPTAGCISMPTDSMKRLLKNLRADAYLLVETTSRIKSKYYL